MRRRWGEWGCHWDARGVSQPVRTPRSPSSQPSPCSHNLQSLPVRSRSPQPSPPARSPAAPHLCDKLRLVVLRARLHQPHRLAEPRLVGLQLLGDDGDALQHALGHRQDLGGQSGFPVRFWGHRQDLGAIVRTWGRALCRQLGGWGWDISGAAAQVGSLGASKRHAFRALTLARTGAPVQGVPSVLPENWCAGSPPAASTGSCSSAWCAGLRVRTPPQRP